MISTAVHGARMRFDTSECDPRADLVVAAAAQEPARTTCADATRVRVGYVLASERVRRDELAASLELALARPLQLVRYTRYAELSEAMVQGFVDVGWLPPAVYVTARRAAGVRAAAIVERGGGDRYRSALLARPHVVHTFADLRGARAAWVDPWSAGGYLMPRGLIAAQGIDPSRVLSSERFYGSYEAALDALVAGTADVAGAICQVDRAGTIVERSWSLAASVRVLQVSPPIPADVLCTSAHLSASEAHAIEASLVGARGEPVAKALGGTGLARPEPSHYDALERAISRAA
jgi:phosphate/phosphite/phosphonate ABC transporter binding protein